MRCKLDLINERDYPTEMKTLELFVSFKNDKTNKVFNYFQNIGKDFKIVFSVQNGSKMNVNGHYEASVSFRVKKE